jgi:predicted transposase/invertase (TIGR01784 family)
VTEPKQPHDALFKKTFSDVEHAAAEFRAVLPAKLVARTDFSTLALCPGSYVDEALSGSQSDLLFSARVAGKPALFYVLFEHQSGPDKLMPLRLLGYVVRILMRYVDEANAASDALPLPVVVPVVLHHGEAGWSVAARLEDLFDHQLVQDAGLTELIPRLGFVLDDLTHVTDEELERRALGLLPLLTLWALHDARSPERLARSLRRWAGAMAELVGAPNGREALWTLFRYIAVVADDSMAATLSTALDAAEPEVKDTLMTLAEKWKAEGEAKGRTEGEAKGRTEGEAKGRTEGEAKGRTEGKAETLRKLLTLKFGELSERAALRIASASEAELDRWVERVLTADTLAAVVDT